MFENAPTAKAETDFLIEQNDAFTGFIQGFENTNQLVFDMRPSGATDIPELASSCKSAFQESRFNLNL